MNQKHTVPEQRPTDGLVNLSIAHFIAHADCFNESFLTRRNILCYGGVPKS